MTDTNTNLALVELVKPTALKVDVDSEATGRELWQIAEDLEAMRLQAAAARVTDAASERKAVETVALVVNMRARVEAVRELLNRPLLDRKAKVDGVLMPLTKTCDAIRKSFDVILGSYRAEQRRLEREAEAKRRAEVEAKEREIAAAAAAQARAAAPVDEADVFAPQPKPVAAGDASGMAAAMVNAGAPARAVAEALVPAVAAVPKAVVTGYGSLGYRDAWEVEVVDLAEAVKANPQLFPIDRGAALALRKALKIDAPEPEGSAGRVPGLRFHKVEKSSFRG